MEKVYRERASKTVSYNLKEYPPTKPAIAIQVHSRYNILQYENTTKASSFDSTYWEVYVEIPY